jgi:hypothetical protein
MYKLTIVLKEDAPLPKVGDTFRIVMLEDGDFDKFDIPYVVATLEPVDKDFYSDSEKEIIGV